MVAAINNRKTLADLLLTAAESYPDKGVSFVQSDGSTKFCSYSELLSSSKSIASALKMKGFGHGDKAMIVMTSPFQLCL